MADEPALDLADDQSTNNKPTRTDKVPVQAKTEPSLNKYFKVVIKMKCSDLHLKAGRPALIRVKGDLRPLTGGPLTDEQIRTGIFELLSEDQKTLYRENGAVDFAHDVGPPGDADRFRVNAFEQRGKMSVAARRVDRSVFKFEDLYLPPQMADIAEFNQGMVLLAGITGSGKSTTIAAMINYINARWPVHIVTIEDPIEYLFTDDKVKCVISRRSAPACTPPRPATWSSARFTLRARPRRSRVFWTCSRRMSGGRFGRPWNST
jgi:twitching motility protein PilT